LRTIQQKDLPSMGDNKRVLGVIRPSTEELGSLTQTKHVGVLGTLGTVQSESYVIELHKFAPEVVVVQHACPMWVPLIENGRHDSKAGRIFIEEDVEQLLSQDPEMDTILLACTHYPILKEYIHYLVGPSIQVVAQGPIVAEKLDWYLNKHLAMQQSLSQTGTCTYFTTENKDVFNAKATQFLGENIQSQHVILP